jgi:CRP/FNR family cyclic AMP-dependent transcriptional regulator
MANQGTPSFNSGELLRSVGNQKTTQEYRNKQSIFSQGDAADAMFYVEKGHVKLTVISKLGKKAVIAILRHGDLFGEGCLARQSLRTSNATAIQLSTIVRVKRATVARIIHQEPAFAKLFISHLLSRMVRIEEDFTDQVFNPSERRLARILLSLTSLGPGSKPDPFGLKVSQSTLAEMIGTTRSRVSYFMNRFRDMGFIDYNGTLHVHPALGTFLRTG